MIDPRQMRPGDVVQLLNSTPLGTVISDRDVRRDRHEAGLRIGDGRTLDLFRYTFWMAKKAKRQRAATKAAEGAKAVAAPLAAYDAIKERARARSHDVSQTGRDIGKLPGVQNAKRKAKCQKSFRAFCETYFPAIFVLKWSPDHLKVIAKIERCVLSGGLFCVAMPRGSGKSSLAEAAAIWAVLYGHRRFVLLIGSDETFAVRMLDRIKGELEGNELLLADFPEALFPIAKLERIANRARGQRHEGKPTHIGWTAFEVVFPSIPGSPASNACIRVDGLRGGIRGHKFRRADGSHVRPDLVIPDDPQTDESARSLPQTAARESTMAGAVLGLAGPGQKLCGIMPCTVIAPGDLADHFLDRDRHPEWNGERTKLLYKFPNKDAMKLWEEYADIRAESYRAGNEGREATAFYKQNRAAMDAGAEVAWPERYLSDEISALQHCMNLYFMNAAKFAAEYQNEPLVDLGAEDALTADDVASRVNRLARARVPQDAEHLTMFIDVMQNALYYVVAAWAKNFSGWILDYGTWPKQRRSYFSLRDIRRSLTEVTGATSLDGAIYQALTQLADQVAGRTWQRDDGQAMRVEKLIVDANWGLSTNAVYKWCRETPLAGIATPSHGRGFKAVHAPLDLHRRKEGERIGQHWKLSIAGPRKVRFALIDTNFWKTFVCQRLRAVVGDAGSLSLWGVHPEEHRMYAEHFVAEYGVQVSANGRTIQEWQARPERPDNHFFDCTVGCAVGASMLGCALAVGKPPAPRPQAAAAPRVRVNLSGPGGRAFFVTAR